MIPGNGRDDQLQGLADELDAMGDGLREVAREAESLDPSTAPGADRVEATLRNAMGPAPKPWYTTVVRAAAAAALVAAIGWAVWPQPSEPVDPGWGTTMGSKVELLAPVGSGASMNEFRWNLGSNPADSVRITVYDAEAGTRLNQVTVDATQPWVPDDSGAWPQAIRWTLEPIQGGNIAEPLEAEAQR